jgi:hydroxypyruvate reductase
VLPASLASTEELAAEYVALAKTMPRGSIYARVAEPSVVLPRTRGQGGRAGRLALLAWNLGLPDDVELACVASDGVDGSSGAAGACVRGHAPSGADRALAAFDDAPFLRTHGASIAGAPSGTNLLDLHLLVRRR